MKAVRLTEMGAALQIEDMPLPTPGDEDVLVRVAGCGVCHTDIGFWKDGVPTRHGLPITLGHEISGVVEDAGSLSHAWIGREVIVPAVIPCGACEMCRAGRGNACRRQLMPGNDMDGGFAEFVSVPARGLCAVESRDSYSLSDLSVIADAVTTPYQAVLRSGLAAGDLAIVVGVGGVGGYAVQIAAARGAHVVALDVDAERLATLSGHGAEFTVNTAVHDFKRVKQLVLDFARQQHVESHRWKIFECSGCARGQETAFGLLGYASTLVIIGFTLEKVAVRLSNLMALDATVQGSWGCRPELYGDALALVTSGAVTLVPFIDRYPMSRGPEVLQLVANHEIRRRAILEPDWST
jgi:6-hydroxycyclohex-1-ene-1-carbonyl-CoA dehydrogenase